MISFNESASALPAVRPGPVVSGFAGAGAGVVRPGFAGVLPDAALSVFGWALAGAPVEVWAGALGWGWAGTWVWDWVFAVGVLEGAFVAVGVVGAGAAGGGVVPWPVAEADAVGEETAADGRESTPVAAGFAGAAAAVSVPDPSFSGPHALSAAHMTPAAMTAAIICLGRTECMKQTPWLLLAAQGDCAAVPPRTRHPDRPTRLAPT
ncbi:hypothetical protein F7Q99_01980 [Streptomyces kaniharaensis]|uniref:Uncharacterized protein n=1 Tax=Streptomyces kaniharaensis TaxID=212423 RepID=A0A6N7KN72_9ACTN|nr:hypothetical protein [Streptomyces kaniharaensis]MQS11083.1 hypothetical protein [Streptomyces kaniharaensis]